MIGDLIPGDVFALDAPARVPAIWGVGSEVLWAAGEPLMICGPAGVGKTTVAQQLALCRAGIADSLDVCGYPIAPNPDALVLYIAADRPAQARRSMRRMVDERVRHDLHARLVATGGPPAVDLLTDPAGFAAWLRVHEIGTVILDSLKDIAPNLSDEQTGATLHRAFQHITGEGVELVVLHHQRKAQDGNRRPRHLADVYGSTWLTAGMGSVVLLWADEAGADIVELRHLKQPAEEVGPLELIHDHVQGHTRAVARLSLEEVLNQAGEEGVSPRAAAKLLAATETPSKAQVERARRKLDQAVKAGQATVERGDERTESVYATVDPRGADHEPPTQASRNSTNPHHSGSRDLHAPSRTTVEASPPLKGGNATDRGAPTNEPDGDAELARLTAKFGEDFAAA